MKLYRARYGNCGLNVLQILTGLSFNFLTNLVMEVRKRHPKNSYGLPCSRKKMLPYVREGIFFNEMIAVINKRKICKKRVVGIYDPPFNQSVWEFADCFRTGTYLVVIKSHFLIVRDGLAYDNQVWGEWLCHHPFQDDKVLAYAILDPSRTCRNIA